MRISLLLAREPFGEIAERTLERFLPAITGREQRVRWRAPGAPRNPAAQRFWVHAYLNAISFERAPVALHAPLLREYGTSLSRWKRPMQRGYMRAAATPGVRRWLAQAAVDVEPGFDAPEEWLIVGGGAKLRLLHRASDRCWAVVKDGFPRRFFEREIDARRAAFEAGVPVPELFEVDRAAGWACERYVEGTPLNRLVDPGRADAVLQRVGGALAAWSRRGRRESTAGDAAAPLLDTARRRVASVRTLDDSIRERSNSVLDALERRLAAAPSAPMPLAPAHGDFQAGNVLHGAEDWIIDWEHAGERVAGYDPLVWHLALRFPVGMAERMAAFARGGGGPATARIERWREDGGGRTEHERRATLDRLALEELSMRLDELDVDLLSVRPAVYDRCLAELERWLAGTA